ncbi:hypothetical protein Tco_0993060 [Tanacetum coccineum]|uniref:Reverse transcriptase domain-containing protein n=1 Tax=Tanacetum coccineum TaxID=301880 RepID=A0ABQ5F3U8_9ASTR
MVSGPEEQPISVNKVKEETVKVAINPEHPEQTVMIGSDLTEKVRIKLCNLLQQSLDIFAWTPADMTVSSKAIISEHRLNVRMVVSALAEEKRQAVKETLQTLTKTINQKHVQVRYPLHDNRLEGRIPVWISLQMLPGRIQRVPSNTNGRGRRGENRFLLQTKKSDFLWTEEAEAAFRQMKEHIAKSPMLTAPEEQEELIIYLAATKKR